MPLASRESESTGNIAGVTERFRAHLEATGLIPSGSRVLVAYSGGPDSTCLLSLLAGTGFDVVAAHLDHGQRPDSDSEVEQCAAFAERLGVAFVSGRADVPGMASALKIGLEEAGRHARYAFFDQVRSQTGAHLVATGHTMDDHVETVLLNLVRGTGLNGLGGIPERRGAVVRPLLPFTAAETRAYCAATGLTTLHDPGNDDPGFDRVRLRHRVVPELEAMRPGFRDSVARFARIASEEDELLDALSARVLESAEANPFPPLAFLTADCELVLDAARLRPEPRALVRRGVRLAFEALGGPVGFDVAESVVESLGSACAFTAPGGEVVAESDGQRLHFRRLDDPEPFQHPLTVPGETEAPDFGWTLTAFPTDPLPNLGGDELDVVVDLARVTAPLHFRSVRPGDRIRPLGAVAEQSVADLLAASKMTRAMRARLPMVCDMVGPVWVPGCRLADRVKITEDSSRGLCLRIGPLRNDGRPGPSER